MTQQFFIGKTQDNYMNVHWNPSTDNSLLVLGYYPRAHKLVHALEKEAKLEESKGLRENTTSPHITIGKNDRQEKRLQETFETRLRFMKNERLGDISDYVKPVYVFPQNSLTFTDHEILAKMLIYGKALNIHTICILGESEYYDPLYDLMTAQVTIHEDNKFSFKSLFNTVDDGVLMKNEE